MEIQIANTENNLRECYPAFNELRPHLSESEFISQAKRQQDNHNYNIVFIKNDGVVVSAAGYRITEYLAWGKTLYIDDLITIKSSRKFGYASSLISYLVKKAKKENCKELHLDSGTHRHEAHSVYKKHKLNISSFHFSNEIVKLNA